MRHISHIPIRRGSAYIIGFEREPFTEKKGEPTNEFVIENGTFKARTNALLILKFINTNPDLKVRFRAGVKEKIVQRYRETPSRDKYLKSLRLRLTKNTLAVIGITPENKNNK